jgi:hypothetical protein
MDLDLPFEVGNWHYLQIVSNELQQIAQPKSQKEDDEEARTSSRGLVFLQHDLGYAQTTLMRWHLKQGYPCCRKEPNWQ